MLHVRTADGAGMQSAGQAVEIAPADDPNAASLHVKFTASTRGGADSLRPRAPLQATG